MTTDGHVSAPASLVGMVRAEARIGMRGAPLRVAVVVAAVLGWAVGGAVGTGAGLSALATGDAACRYLVFGAIYWLAMLAARDDTSGITNIVLSKPQPMERLVVARFLGGYAQVLLLLAALFAGAAASRLVASGSLVGFSAYPLVFGRSAIVLFFASSATYTLALMAGTPLAGALVAMYWLMTFAGQAYLAKVYYPYYTQNLGIYLALGAFLVGLTARLHRRRRRGDTAPALWCRILPPIALVAAGMLVLGVILGGHDPLMRESALMTEMARQDATLHRQIPGFVLPNQSGRLTSLSGTPGKVFVIALVAPDTEEGALLLDRLNRLHRQLGARGVFPVAVCIGNDDGAARTISTGGRLTFPVVTDWGSHHAPKAADASPIASAFRVIDMPYVAVTDRRRRIRDTMEGISTYDGPRLEEAVADRLREEPR